MQDFDQDQKQNAENAFNQKNLKMIMKIYSDALNQQNQKSFQLTELHFSYLTLLSTLNLNSCSSYCSILNIQSNIKLRLGWKDKQKLVTILKLANFQSYLNQIRMKKENEFQLYHILQFEDEMNVIQKQYFECMKQYKIVVEKLSMSYIEINEIFLLLKSYREERGNLEQKIKAQLQYNSNSEILKNLCINFDFYMLHNQSLLRFYEKQSRKSILLLKNKEYYSKQSCFVYISLLEKSFSLIQKVNKAFVQAFGFANKSFILNKSILQLFPNNFLKKSSEKLLSQIITENFLSLYNQSINIPLFIGKNSLGYAIPLQLKVQSQIVNQNDFGITVWAKPIKDDNLYILLDFKDHSLIKVASKIFCDEFMYDNFTLNCLKTLRMDSLIPIIDDLIRLSSIEIGKKFETLLIQPLDKEQAQQKPNIKDPYFLNYLKFQDLFLVTLQIHSFDFKLTQFVRVVIENYEPIYNYKDKIQHIQMYQIQIKELTGVSLDFDPSIELENLVDNRAKSINFENSSYKNRIFKYKTRKESNLNINESTAEMLDQSSSQIQQSQIHNQQYKQNQKPSQYQTKDYNLTNEASNLNNSQIPLDQNQDIFMIHSIQEQPIQYIQENQINQQNLNKFVKNEKDYYNSHQNLIANQVDSSLYIGNSMFNNNLQQDCQLTKDESYYMNFNEHQQSNEALQAFNKKYQASKFEQISMIQEDNLELNSKNTCIVQDTDNNKKGFKEQNFKQYSNSQLLSSKNALQFNGVNRQRISSKNEEKIKLQKHETNQESENILPCDENKIQKKQDIQSVSSSSKSVKNKYLFEMIHAKKQMNYLKVINFIGIVSVSITLFLTLEGFFTFYNSLISQRENFKFINWIYMVNIELSYALSERYLLELNRLNYLQTPDSMNEIFNEELYNENISRIRKSKDQMILLYNTTNPNIQVFEIIKNKKITQNIYFNKTESSQMQLSIKYSILLQISGMFYIIEDLDPYQIMAQQNQANYLAINNEVSSIFNELNSVYQSQLNSILSQSETQLFVIFSVSLFVLSCIVPSFIFTKIRQQKMLELFATFDPQSLKEILIQLTYQLQAYGGLDKSQTLASKSNISNMNQTQISKQAQVVVNVQKKLNISRTSTIKYSIKYLVLALLFIFGLIMIYPSFFYVTVRKFVDNSKIIFQFNNVVCETYFTVVNTNRARQGLFTAFLTPQNQAIPISQYQSDIEDILETVRKLTDTINQNLAEVEKSDLYNQELFKDYLTKIYSENACDTIQNYTQYQNGDFQYNSCSTTAKGALQKGLINGVVYFSTVFRDFTSFAFSYDLESFQKGLQKYFHNNPAYKTFQFKDELSKAHEYLMNFFQDQNLQLYNHYENVCIALVSFQVIFVTTIFVVCWYIYFRNINDIIFSTKQLLDIFPQATLIQNTYIMSYLRKNE